MSIFDLVFLVAALALVGSVCTALYQLVRGRLSRALAVGRRIAIAAALYFAVIVATSLATPQQVVRIGEAQCFDDWCITAAHRSRAGDTMTVNILLSSKARGISQGERDVRVYLIDDSGARREAIPDASDVPLSVTIPPSGEVQVTRRFLLPAETHHPALIVAHDAFPHCCIIGDRESLFHRAAIVAL